MLSKYKTFSFYLYFKVCTIIRLRIYLVYVLRVYPKIDEIDEEYEQLEVIDCLKALSATFLTIKFSHVKECLCFLPIG